MNKIIFVLIPALLACTDSQDPVSPTGPQEEGEVPADDGALAYGDAVELSIRGDTLFYKGGTDPASYEKFTSIVEGKENEIKTMVVNSPGGDIIEGMLIGDWVFDNGVDVAVDTLCFSSCANYIFTAGQNKIIREGGIVGWHGSAQQEMVIAESTGKSLDEVFRELAVDFLKENGEANPSESKIEEEIKLIQEMTAQDTAREQEFLEKIGVPVDALVYGLKKSQYEEYRSSNAGGWTLSIEDMAKLGIRNATYLGQGSYPDPEKVRLVNVVLLKVE